MKKYFYFVISTMMFFLFLSINTLNAQQVIKTWDFESSLEDWASGNGGATIALSAEQAHAGSQSVKLVKSNTHTEINLQNDVYKPEEGDVMSCWVWISSADLANVNGVQVFWQAENWAKWHSKWINGTDVTGDAWYQITAELSPMESPLNRIGIQSTGKGGTEAASVTMYVDDITISRAAAPEFVSDWGAIGRFGWPIIPGVAPGEAGMGGAGRPQGAWATLRGQFEPLTATESQAVVVTGKMEFLGDGPTSWSALRYGIFRHDSAGTLTWGGTDSARWTGRENYAYGYMFTPHSGTNDQVSWANGGNGTHGVINGGSWISSNGPGGSMGVINQAPARAVMTQGVYNWAFSVRPLSDGNNEVKWFIVKEDNSYWFGGTDIDTFGVTTTFNGVVFGINPGNGIENTAITGLKVTEVTATTGDPIVVPEAPFSSFYVDQWGFITTGHGWQFKVDPDTLMGNAGMGGTNPPAAWAGLLGGFDPVIPTTEKAVIVTGSIEFQGGDVTNWSALRYGFYYTDSVKVLKNAVTDSAAWTGHANNAHGYLFTPRSGTNDQVTGNGGIGSQWTVNGGRWNSTWSAGNLAAGVINPAPARAKLTAGKYNFAMSLQPLADGSNEVRWFLIKEDNSYWFGGSIKDTAQVTTKVNGVIFGIINGVDTGLNTVLLTDVKVDMGAPVTVPPAPFSSFYLDQWGFITTGHGWQFKVDPDTLMGNAGMGGTNPPAQWAGLHGGFDPVNVPTDKALAITGNIEFQGGDVTNWSALRYGFYYNDSTKTLKNAVTDSAAWSGHANNVYGYLLTPRSGTNDQVTGNGGIGTQWTVNGGRWNSTWSAGNLAAGVVNPAPARAKITAGKYKFGISVQAKLDGTNEVRWYLIKEDNSYWFGGTFIDTAQVTTKVNGVTFGIINGVDTGLNTVLLTDVKLDMIEQLNIPEAPFSPFYVKDWAFIGGKTNGWTYTPGELDGNVTISGSALTDWAAIRGQFEGDVVLRTSKALRLTGKMELEGGGFETAGSLRLGLFTTEKAGKIDSTTYTWTGEEGSHTGYLFLPNSGTNILLNWAGAGQEGSVGGIVDSVWMNTDGSKNYVLTSAQQQPANAVASAGTYDLAISIALINTGTTELREIRYYISKEDKSYHFGGILQDVNPLAANRFNSINFAINNPTTTALKITDIYVDLGNQLDSILVVSVDSKDQMPTEFSLSQNYPNPFNPTTRIDFALPKSSNVTLIVYDILGKVVATLAEGQYDAGYHKINFNAANLSSGVYFYSIKADDFVSVKKLMLLK